MALSRKLCQLQKASREGKSCDSCLSYSVLHIEETSCFFTGCPAASITKSPSLKDPPPQCHPSTFRWEMVRGETTSHPTRSDKVFTTGQSPGSQKQFLAVGLLQLLASSSRSLRRLTGDGREVPLPAEELYWQLIAAGRGGVDFC